MRNNISLYIVCVQSPGVYDGRSSMRFACLSQMGQVKSLLRSLLSLKAPFVTLRNKRAVSVKNQEEFVKNANQIELVVEIVTAFISFNPLPARDLGNLIGLIHEGISGATHQNPAEERIQHRPKPAILVQKSVTQDYLICLDDGRRYKSLRRHIAILGMTPAQYRAKWRLPPDYPMVAANYTLKRSEMARKSGLGRKSTAETTSES